MKSDELRLVAGALALALPRPWPRTSRWRGRLAAGQTLEVRGINGGITAEQSGGEAEVTAVKSAPEQQPGQRRDQDVEHAGGVTICAVYPGSWGASNECEPGAAAEEHAQQRRAGGVHGQGAGRRQARRRTR